MTNYVENYLLEIGQPTDPISATFYALWKAFGDSTELASLVKPANAKLMRKESDTTQAPNEADVPSVMLTIDRLSAVGVDSSTDMLQLYCTWQVLTGDLVFYNGKLNAILWELFRVTRKLDLTTAPDILPGVVLEKVEPDANSTLGLGELPGKNVVIGHSSRYSFRVDLLVERSLYV